MTHDYPALAQDLRLAALRLGELQDKLDKDTPGTRAYEAWGMLDNALDHIDSALRSLESEDDDYPADPPGTADVIAASNAIPRRTP